MPRRATTIRVKEVDLEMVVRYLNETNAQVMEANNFLNRRKCAGRHRTRVAYKIKFIPGTKATTLPVPTCMQ